MAERGRPVQVEIQQTRAFRSPAQEATVAVLRTADHVRHLLAAVIEAEGITLQQYNVLRILRGARPEPLPTLEIGERLIERTPGITRLLDRLAAKGLVERDRAAEDRRLVLCRITVGGLALLSALDGPVDRADDQAMAGLTTAQVRTLIRLLDRVRSHP